MDNRQIDADNFQGKMQAEETAVFNGGVASGAEIKAMDEVVIEETAAIRDGSVTYNQAMSEIGNKVADAMKAVDPVDDPETDECDGCECECSQYNI